MTLSLEAVTSFQRLYLSKCGIKLEYQDAEFEALKELQRFALIYKSIPKNDQKYLLKLRTNKK
ncbi:hypothetical protein KKI22_00700 [Patescibacteria group bacterium]|nr:hypothetical protein [Patescibacteria group bacterium]